MRTFSEISGLSCAMSFWHDRGQCGNTKFRNTPSWCQGLEKARRPFLTKNGGSGRGQSSRWQVQAQLGAKKGPGQQGNRWVRGRKLKRPIGPLKRGSVFGGRTSGNCKKKTGWEEGSLRKTYKSQTEASDREWSLNLETEKALEELASLYNRFEQSNRDLCDIDRSMTLSSRKWRTILEKR